jgi:hypothetical protein
MLYRMVVKQRFARVYARAKDFELSDIGFEFRLFCHCSEGVLVCTSSFSTRSVRLFRQVPKLLISWEQARFRPNKEYVSNVSLGSGFPDVPGHFHFAIKSKKAAESVGRLGSFYCHSFYLSSTVPLA